MKRASVAPAILPADNRERRQDCRRHIGAALIALALLSLGAGNPLTQVYIDGETLDYELVWLRISGGSARMTIAPAGETSYRLTSIGKSSKTFSRIYAVRDEIETFA